MKKLFLILPAIALMASHAGAQNVPLPHHLNFDGQLLDNNGAPLTSSTPVTFEIYDGNGTTFCLLYKVTQTITPNSLGEFTTKIGPDAEAGHTASPDDGNIPWPTIFKNSGEIRANEPTFCNGGYTPAAGHARKLRVTVDTTVLSPDYTIAPVPMATVAETLQGKVANDFLLAAPSTASAFTSVLSGNLRLNNNYGLQLTNSASTNFVSLRAPTALTAAYSLVLPMDDGNSGDVLTTDGSGVLSWVTPVSGSVTSVFGRSGPVVAVAGDYTAAQISSTAVGAITATNVQSAIGQLESGKMSVGTMINGTMISDGSIAGIDIAASSILDTNLTNVSVDKITTAIGQYFSYAPGGTTCLPNETLSWDGMNWVCYTLPPPLPPQPTNAGRFLTTNGTTASWFPDLIQDGNGRIGLGTTLPSSLLHLVSSNTTQTLESASGVNSARLLFKASRASTNLSVGDIVFQNALNGNSFASIKGVTDTVGVTDGAILFSTGSTTPLERVRINSGGSVGIGTTTPTSMLDVAGTVKLGTTGTIFSASGVCVTTSNSYAANTATTHNCPGIPATTNVAVHCSPSAPVLGYIVAHATGTINQISITTGVVAASVVMTCMWMTP